MTVTVTDGTARSGKRRGNEALLGHPSRGRKLDRTARTSALPSPANATRARLFGNGLDGREPLPPASRRRTASRSSRPGHAGPGDRVIASTAELPPRQRALKRQTGHGSQGLAESRGGRLLNAERQPDHERRALPGRRFDLERALVGGDDVTGDREPQARAADGRRGVGRAEELLEDALGVLRADADPVVGDGDDGVAAPRRAPRPAPRRPAAST